MNKKIFYAEASYSNDEISEVIRVLEEKELSKGIILKSLTV